MRVVLVVVLSILWEASAFAQTTDFLELVKTGTAQEVQAAIAKGADPNALGSGGMTALIWAAAKNQDPLVTAALLKAGASVNTRDKDGMTALMYAAKSNHNREVVTALVKAGAKVDAKNDDGATALILAALSENTSPMLTLLEAGADRELKDKSGKTFMDYLNERQRKLEREAELKHEADMLAAFSAQEERSKNTTLVVIIVPFSLGLLYVVYRRVQNKRAIRTVKAKADAYVSSFMDAAAKGPEALATFLGTETNLEAPLLLDAIKNSPDPEAIALLLKTGAALESLDADGWTPLRWAAAYNPNPEVLTTLVKAGANVNAQDSAGVTR
jgi:serine/threonine-protein phosphatase 6 regulatory ankyrin repeat subunit B